MKVPSVHYVEDVQRQHTTAEPSCGYRWICRWCLHAPPNYPKTGQASVYNEWLNVLRHKKNATVEAGWWQRCCHLHLWWRRCTWYYAFNCLCQCWSTPKIQGARWFTMHRIHHHLLFSKSIAHINGGRLTPWTVTFNKDSKKSVSHRMWYHLDGWRLKSNLYPVQLEIHNHKFMLNMKLKFQDFCFSSATSWAADFQEQAAEVIVMGFVEPFTKELQWNMLLNLTA